MSVYSAAPSHAIGVWLRAVLFGLFVLKGAFALLLWAASRRPAVMTLPAQVCARHAVAAPLPNRPGQCARHYSATFQLTPQQRLEVAVSAAQYRALHEGDRGYVYLRGTKYLRFTPAPAANAPHPQPTGQLPPP